MIINKGYTSLLFVLLIAYSSLAQTNYDAILFASHYVEVDLRNDIKSPAKRIIKTSFNSQRKAVSFKELLILSKDGRLTEYKQFNPSKLILECKYQYNDRGLLSEQDCQYVDAPNYQEKKCRKDSFIYHYNNFDIITGAEHFENGKKIYKADSIVLNKNFVIQSYNRTLFWMSNQNINEPYQKCTLKYTNNNRISSILISYLEQNKSKNYILRSYSYNNYRFINEYKESIVSDLFINGPQKYEKHEKYEYEVDKKGNWVKKFRIENYKKRLVVKRKIYYY